MRKFQFHNLAKTGFMLRRWGTLAGLLSLCAVLSVASPYFLTVSNLLNVLQQTSINAIIAIGMTYVIITAGIDLSVGSLLALCGVLLGSALHNGWPLAAALAATLIAGALLGLANGLMISAGRLPPFIATLGMMSMARGAALVYTHGRPISGFSPNFRLLATGEVAYIPVPVIIMIAAYAVAHVILSRTRAGRYFYAIGGNEEAAFLSGVRVRKYKTLAYVASGVTSACAAILLTARLNSAQPIAGIMYELDAIAATVIGGTSLMGGEGTLIGTFFGALIMGVLRNGLNLLGVSSYLQQFIIGAVIILAVLADTLLQRKK